MYKQRPLGPGIASSRFQANRCLPTLEHKSCPVPIDRCNRNPECSYLKEITDSNFTNRTTDREAPADVYSAQGVAPLTLRNRLPGPTLG